MSVTIPLVMLLFLFSGILISAFESLKKVMIGLYMNKEFVIIKIIKGIEAIDWYNNYKYNARIS